MKSILLLSLVLSIMTIMRVIYLLIKKSTFKGRRPVPLKDIYETKVKQYGIEFDVFKDVFETMGKFFKIKPSILLPEDKWKELTNMDSWNAYCGIDDMEEWLVEKKVNPQGKKIETILDILLLVQETKQKTS